MALRVGARLSIAGRLLASAAIWTMLILAIAGVGLSAIYRKITVASFDDRIAVSLKALVADLASPEEDTRLGPGQLGEPQFELTRSGWYWQVTRLDAGAARDKERIRASRSLFSARLPRLAAAGGALAATGKGFVIGPDQRRLRMLERIIDSGDQGRFLVQVAADAAEIDAQVGRFQMALGATFVLLAIALIGTSTFQVRYGLLPLRRLQEGVGAIRRGESDKIGGAFPPDLATLASELNLLVDANHEIVARARTHVGNLAHALKTPLSVLRNEAEPRADPLADKVREQTEVMTRQVNYHLERARAAARAGSIGVCAGVEPTLAGLVRTFEKIYRDRGLAFAQIVEPGLRFRGEQQDLEEMLGNLLDNAGKWAASRISIQAMANRETDAGRAMLTILIDDDGPGLPEASRLEALKRGHRLDESKPGSGLGLAIVADLAALHGGRLALSDGRLGGLRAQLHLPAVA